MKQSLFAGLLALNGLSATEALAEMHGDPEEGEKLFRRCASCHMVGEDAVNRVGPVLTNVFGAAIAGNPDFRYSNALRDAGEAGGVWNETSLDAFLTKPRDYLPGNRMTFRGISNADDRAHLIAFLRTLTMGDGANAESTGFSVDPAILAIEGDVEYGEYLASECKTCHQASGGDDGIPNIVGLPTEEFATAMHAYRAKFRENSVMQLIAGRLNDEEIAALAAFFRDLES